MLSKGETFTVVEDLTGDALLHEIAEMIGGNNKSTATPRQAREMLEGEWPQGKTSFPSTAW